MDAKRILALAAQAAGDGPVDGFPARHLRFVLEYPSPPDEAAARIAIAEFVGSTRFDLRPVHPLMPEFLVLQFAGVERLIAAETLYAVANALVDELGLISAEPDITVGLVMVPNDDDANDADLGQIRTESAVKSAFNASCRVPAMPEIDPNWPVKSMRVDAAWVKTKGAGAVIVQADTGIATHQELDDRVDHARGRNLLSGAGNGRDPLDGDQKFAGHGTATASVTVSSGGGGVNGIAPEARIVPVRCTESVLIGTDPSPIAEAIAYAIEIEADVIAMSIGGAFHSRAISRALKLATAAGIIPVAAAGNCVHRIVAYPARDSSVICVAGVNIDDQPWRGTSIGAPVDVAAPGENLHVARRRPGDQTTDLVEVSQGTSYSAACGAGVAALWVAHWGRDAIREAADAAGLEVVELFRRAVAATARKPADWQAGMGAGIIDAGALLSLPLPTGPGGLAVAESVALSDLDPLSAQFEAVADAAAADPDLRAVSAEAVHLVADAWTRANSLLLPLESPRRPRPSPALAAASVAPVRAALSLSADGPDLAPPLPAQAGRAPYARMLAAAEATGLQSSGAISDSDARDMLRGDTGQQVRARIEDTIDALDSGASDGSADRQAVINNAARVIDRVAEDDLDQLTMDERVTLEAIVRIKDRPAFATRNGNINPADPLRGEWGSFLFELDIVPAFANSVGRIDLAGRQAGTGFVIAPGLIMTNRHVLEGIADQYRGPQGDFWAFSRGDATIDFADRADSGAAIALTEVVMAGPDPIGRFEDLDQLDMAVIRMAAPGPAPLTFARNPAPVTDVMTIGYPATPDELACIDPETGRLSIEIARRMGRVFGTRYGRRYVSPGRINTAIGDVPGDPKSWVFNHDCTTLGGNSGSVVVQLNSDDGVIAVTGLHFSGKPLTANRAHGMDAVDRRIGGINTAITWLGGG